MTKSIRWGIVLIAGALLIGCNQDNNDSPDPDPNPDLSPELGGADDSGGNQPQTKTQVSGTVADGYIVGATVCSDTNQNGACDLNEPQAVTGGGGRYTLSLEPSEVGQYPLVVEVPTTAYDEDTQEYFTGPFTLTAPAGKTGFISPLTSLVAAKMAMQPGLTVEAAEQEILQRMNMAGQGASLFHDYVADDGNALYQQQHTIGRAMATMLIATQQRLTEMAAAGSPLDELNPAQRYVAAMAMMEDRLDDLAGAVAFNTPTDNLVAEWTEELNSDVSDDLLISIHRAGELSGNAAPIDVAEFFMNEGINNFWIGGDDFYTWRSTGIANTGEHIFADFMFDSSQQQFVDDVPHWDRTTLLITDNGDLVRGDLEEDYQDFVFDIPDSDAAIYSYIMSSEGSEYLIDEALHTGSVIDISGQPLWQVLSEFNDIRPTYDNLFDPTATLAAGSKAIATEYYPSGDPIWTINHWDGCDDDRLSQLGETHPLMLDNCDLVWVTGFDLYEESSTNELTDLFNTSAFVPSGNLNQDYNRISDHGEARLVKVGSVTSREFVNDEGETDAPRLLAEIVGDPNSQSFGDIHWYYEDYSIDWRVPFSTDCQQYWEEYWNQVNGNCETLDFVNLPGSYDIPEELDDVIRSSPTLAIGDVISRNHLNTFDTDQVIIGTGGDYAYGDIDAEVTGSNGNVFEYTSPLYMELLGASSDTQGDVGLYYGTLEPVVYVDYWPCNDDDPRGDIPIINTNCNVFQEVDFSVTTTLSDHFMTTDPVISGGDADEVLEGIPYVIFGTLSRDNETSCSDGDHPPLMGFMVGSPDNDNGDFVLLNAYFDETDNCPLQVEPLIPVNWTKFSGPWGDVFEIDLSPVIATGEVDSFFGDWSSDTTFYLVADGNLLRKASYDALDNHIHRLAPTATWERTIVDGREALQVTFPDDVFLPGDERSSRVMVVDNGLVRYLEWEEVTQLNPLGHTTTWTLHTRPNASILELERPPMPGLWLWWHGFTDIGNRIRGAHNHLRQYENEGITKKRRYQYTTNVIDQIEEQIEQNYEPTEW